MENPVGMATAASNVAPAAGSACGERQSARRVDQIEEQHGDVFVVDGWHSLHSGRWLPNARVQLRASYNQCGEAASKDRPSAATIVRLLVTIRSRSPPARR